MEDRILELAWVRKPIVEKVPCSFRLPSGLPVLRRLKEAHQAVTGAGACEIPRSVHRGAGLMDECKAKCCVALK